MTVPLDRAKLVRDAQDTVQVLHQGFYERGSGPVDLTAHLARLRVGTRLYTPEELRALTVLRPPALHDTHVEVTPETTLSAAQRMLGARQTPVAVLNFASATSPGGGFLRGAAAQEESIARASGLYASLTLHPEYYDLHRTAHDRVYTDRMMFARDVPVFRGEDGEWRDAPYHIDVLTAAAPNLRGLHEREVGEVTPRARAAIERRADQLLALFSHQRCPRLVLGAWGCGAFRNDPEHVADTFACLLEGPYRGVFEEVVFAVFAMPWEERNLNAFQRRVGRAG